MILAHVYVGESALVVKSPRPPLMPLAGALIDSAPSFLCAASAADTQSAASLASA